MKIDLDDRFTEPVGVSGDDPLPGNTRKVTIELWYVEILAEAEMSQPEPLPHSDSGHPETVMISYPLFAEPFQIINFYLENRV